MKSYKKNLKSRKTRKSKLSRKTKSKLSRKTKRGGSEKLRPLTVAELQQKIGSCYKLDNNIFKIDSVGYNQLFRANCVYSEVLINGRWKYNNIYDMPINTFNEYYTNVNGNEKLVFLDNCPDEQGIN